MLSRFRCLSLNRTIYVFCAKNYGAKMASSSKKALRKPKAESLEKDSGIVVVSLLI